MADPSWLWLDSFDYPYSDIALHYNTIVNDSSLSTISTTYGAGGRRGFGVSSNSQFNWLGKTTPDVACVAFEGRFVALGGVGNTSTLNQLDFFDAVDSVYQLSLRLGVDYKWRLYRSSDLMATFPVAIVPQVKYSIGVKLLVGNGTSGSIYATLNGVEQVNLTGIDSQASGNAFVSQIRFGCRSTSGSDALRFGWSDICMQADASAANVSLRGDCAARPIVITSDATPNDGTTTSGADHFAMADDGTSGQDGDTTTLTLPTDGDEERFGHANLPAGVAAVKAICQKTIAKKTDAGTCKFRHRLYIASTTYDGDQHAPSEGTYAEFFKGRILNPNTAAEFTTGEIDALVGGFVRDDS